MSAYLFGFECKTIPMTFDERIQRLNWLIRGWLNYFKHASIHGKLKTLDGWIRNCLRYCIWHHWMTERSRRVTDRSRRVKVLWTFKGRNREAGRLAIQWTFKRENREAGGLAVQWTFKRENREAGGRAVRWTFKGRNREAGG